MEMLFVCIWEYTKLPEKEQQFVYEQYKVLSDDSRNESDVDAVLIKLIIRKI